MTPYTSSLVGGYQSYGKDGYCSLRPELHLILSHPTKTSEERRYSQTWAVCFTPQPFFYALFGQEVWRPPDCVLFCAGQKLDRRFGGRQTVFCSVPDRNLTGGLAAAGLCFVLCRTEIGQEVWRPPDCVLFCAGQKSVLVAFEMPYS
jgi:hypothetical protein